MFGSLRIDDHRLDDTTRAAYRAHFCGACHAMRAFGGRSCSLLTNYDETVLMLVVAGLGNGARRDRKACTALPLRSVGVVEIAPQTTRFVAAATVAAVGAKLRDDVEDEGRMRSRVALRLLGKRERRALAELKDLGFRVERVANLPQLQSLAERSRDATLDDLAQPSAELCGEVFAHAAVVSGRLEAQPALRAFGRALGEFVYTWDALVDLQEDLTRNRFNALAHVHGRDPSLLDVVPTRSALRRRLHAAVERCEEALRSVELTATPTQLLSALLASLHRKVDHELCARGYDLAQAGDCDCSCCESVSCCGGDSSCACCESSCSACDCCCWASEAKRQKREAKQQRPH